MRLFWSVSLLGAALLSGGIARATDLSAACAPAVRLDGERALIAPIRASLQARGVAEGGALACQRLEVRVLPASPGYDLFLTDAEGRTDRRQIARADTAAMVIESWLQADLSDPLLDRGPPPIPPADPAAAVSLAASAPPPPSSPAGRSLVPRSLGTLRGESAIDRGAAMWWGAAAGACLRMGPLCAGPQARLRVSAGPPGVTTSSRSLEDLRSLEGGLTLEAPLALGPVRVLPGIFLGAGRLSGRWHQQPLLEPSERERDRDRDRGDDRNPGRTSGRGDRSDRDQQDVAVDESFSRVGLRAGAGLGLALPLGVGLAVELQLAVGVRPVAPDGGPGGRAPARSGMVGHAGVGLGLRYGAL